MDGTATQPEQPTFPRTGSNYAPLPRGKQDGRVLAHAVQTINATPDQIFQIYSRPELLPAWQEGVVSVTTTGENTLHWVVQDPGTDKQVEFDSEILEVVPGVRHVSRIVNGPVESTTATFTLAENAFGRGTIATLVTDFKVPGGAIANAVAAVISRSPEQTTIENLRHLKQLIESREIPSVEGQPTGPRGIIGKWKEFLLGENIPTPPGTTDRSRPQDLPVDHEGNKTAILLGCVALIAGLTAWFGVRHLR
jgi:uncharacterized membrane protein